MPGYRQLARNRDFTVLWIGDTVSELGSALSMFAFPLIAYGVIFNMVIAAIGGLTLLAGMVGWALEPPDDPDLPPHDDHGPPDDTGAAAELEVRPLPEPDAAPEPVREEVTAGD